MLPKELLQEKFEKSHLSEEPKSPRPPISPRELFIEELLDVLEFQNRALIDVQIEKTNLKERSFRNCIIKGCRFFDCDFSGTAFDDVTFLGCDFSNSIFEHCFFQRCRIEDCKFTGASFIEGSFFQSYLVESALSLGSFFGTRWNRVVVKDCDFSKSDMSGMTLQKVTLERANLIEVSLLDTALAGIDLRSSELQGIILSESLKELVACKLDPLQAAALLQRFGVIIE